jgi:hypothetical protein
MTECVTIGLKMQVNAIWFVFMCLYNICVQNLSAIHRYLLRHMYKIMNKAK